MGSRRCFRRSCRTSSRARRSTRFRRRAHRHGGVADHPRWHFKRADAIAGYTIFVPTGRYTDGADNNTGLGMWGHELRFGTTVYLNEARQYHAATLLTFDFQSKKEDSETKVGNAMNIEGGVGGDFLQGGLSAGLIYYARFKLTDDEIDGFPNISVRGKNKVFALGPEVPWRSHAKVSCMAP